MHPNRGKNKEKQLSKTPCAVNYFEAWHRAAKTLFRNSSNGHTVDSPHNALENRVLLLKDAQPPPVSLQFPAKQLLDGCTLIPTAAALDCDPFLRIDNPQEIIITF